MNVRKPGIFPFERPYNNVKANIEQYAETVIASLQSSFLTMPKGKGFVEYEAFEQAYENLKHATTGFTRLSCDSIKAAIEGNPLSFIVLRTILGFTPPEWAQTHRPHRAQKIPHNVETGNEAVRHRLRLRAFGLPPSR
jgi:hypothetical protein